LQFSIGFGALQGLGLTLISNVQRVLPVLQMLNAANAFERSIHHDCYATAEGFTFFHAASHSTTPQKLTKTLAL